jgi:MFS family permease
MPNDKPKPKHLSWYHGWNIVTVCILSQVAALGLTLNCLSLFLHGWSVEFHTPISTLALSVTLFSLGSAVVSPFIGVFADKYSARWLFGGALAALALFHVAIGFLGAGWQIVALYAVILPLAVGLSASITSQAAVSRWFVRKVGLAMGLTAFGLALAGVVLPPIIVALLPAFGWRGVWWLGAAVIGLIILPLVFFTMRDRPTLEEGAHYVGAPAEIHKVVKLTAKEIFSRRNFWVAIGVFLSVQLMSMGVTINLAPIVLSHGFPQSTAGGLISLLSISALVAKLGVGMLADRIGNKIPLVLMALVSAAGAGLLAMATDSLPMLSIAFVFIGLSGGIWTLLASATAAEFGAQGFGRAFGLICAFTPIGSLAPPLVAKIEEVTGSYAPGLLGLAVLSLAGAGLAVMLKERRGHRPAAAPALDAATDVAA